MNHYSAVNVSNNEQLPHIHQSLILGELQLLITAMRRNKKFKTQAFPSHSTSGSNNNNNSSDSHSHHPNSSHIPSDNYSLLQNFDRLRWNLNCNTSLVDIILPFHLMIVSPMTSGYLTSLALQSLTKFVNNNIINTESIDSIKAISIMAQSTCDCKFESIDTSSDEILLSRLLQLQILILSHPHIGPLCSDSTIWAMFQQMYKILRTMRVQTDYSELLADQAEQTFLQLLKLLFSRVNGESVAQWDLNNTQMSTLEDIIDGNTIHREYYNGYPVLLKIMQFLATYCEVIHTDISFDFSLANNIPLANLNAPLSPLSPELSPTHSPTNDPNDANKKSDLNELTSTFFPCSRILLSSDEMVDFGLLYIPPPPNINQLQTSSQSIINKSISDWLCHSIFCTQTILTVIESSGPHLMNVPLFNKYISDNICKFLLRNSRYSHALLYSLTLRTFYVLYCNHRQYIPMQIETFINTVYLKHLQHKQTNNSVNNNSGGSNNNTGNPINILDPTTNNYDLRELTLESLLDLCHESYFLSELYINYDCNPESTNCFENLFRILCKSVFPTSSNLLTSNHILALKCLLEGCKQIKTRCEKSLAHHRISTTMKHNNNSNNNNNIYRSSSAIHEAELDDFAATVEKIDSELKLNINDSFNAAGANTIDPSSNPYLCLLSDLRASRVYKRQLSVCVEEFNKKPTKGLALMCTTLGLFLQYETLRSTIEQNKSHQLTQEEQNQIIKLARFLRYTPSLDKVTIGTFISEYGVFPSLIRKEFVDLFDFSGRTLDSAMRIFLEAFRLPLEAQQIDRVLQSFAIRYYNTNPNLLANADAIHTLAFSLIMLNTDQHNILIKNKMTLQQFINNNRGINNGQNIPKAMLEGLYYTIKRKEIKMSGDGLTGEINDALWEDLLIQGKNLYTKRPFLRLDQINSGKFNFSSLIVNGAKTNDTLTQSLTIHQHVIGETLYKPPILTNFTSPYIQSRSLTQVPHLNYSDSSIHQSPQPTRSSSNNTPDNPTPSTSTAHTTPHRSSSTVQTISTVTPPALNLQCLTVDEDMFLEVWNPLIAALSVVFDLFQPSKTNKHGRRLSLNGSASSNNLQASNNGSTHGKSIHNHFENIYSGSSGSVQNYVRDGYNILSGIASAFAKFHIVDNIVSTIAKFTSLPAAYRAYNSSPNSNHRSQALEHKHHSLLHFASHYKAQFSLIIMFELVHEYNNSIRNGWNDVILVILQLFSMDLLPKSMIILDDFSSAIGNSNTEESDSLPCNRSEILIRVAPRINEGQTTSGGFWSYFLSGNNNNNDSAENLENDPTLIEAVHKVQHCIELCDINGILIESKLLTVEVLRSFMSSLVEIVPLKSIIQLNYTYPASTYKSKLVQNKHSNTPKSSVSSNNNNKPTSPKSAGAVSKTPTNPFLQSNGVSMNGVDHINEGVGGFTIQDFNSTMMNYSIYNENDQALFPSVISCSDCPNSVGYLDIPIEIRRLLLNIQLLTNIMLLNRDRIHRIWPPFKHYINIIIQYQSLQSNNSSVNTSHTSETGPSTENPQLPAIIIESAVVSLLKITHRILYMDTMNHSDIVSTTLKLIFGLSYHHTSIIQQISAALLLMVRDYSTAIHSSSDWIQILQILQKLSLYQATAIQSLNTLYLIVLSASNAISVHTFNMLMDTILTYFRSRWATPQSSTICAELLFRLGNLFTVYFQQYISSNTDNQTSVNGTAANISPTNLKSSSVHAELIQALPEPVELNAYASRSKQGFSTSASLLDPLSLKPVDYYGLYFKSYLLHFRNLTQLANARIQLLVRGQAKVHQQRANNKNGSENNNNIDYSEYIAGFASMRKLILQLLHQTLIVDILPNDTNNTSNMHLFVSSLTPSQIELVFNDILFPILHELTADNFDTGDHLMNTRILAIQLLSKMYLKNLDRLMDHTAILHRLWLNCLKCLDSYCSLAVQSKCSPLLESCEQIIKNLLLILKNHNPEVGSEKMKLTQEMKEVTNITTPSSPNNDNQYNGLVLIPAELMELTWNILDPFFPNMKKQLFPQLESINATTTATTATTEANNTNSINHAGETTVTSTSTILV